MVKARLVLEAPTIVSQIPICFGGNSKYCCHGWGRILSGFGEVVQSLNRGPPAPIRKDGVTVKMRARGFLWMGTQPSQVCQLCPQCPGAGSSPGVGNKGLLQLSSAQSRHMLHIHCRLLHLPSWQGNSPGLQGPAGTGGTCLNPHALH